MTISGKYASLTRIVIALLAAVILGVPVGIAMGLNDTEIGRAHV